MTRDNPGFNGAAITTALSSAFAVALADSIDLATDGPIPPAEAVLADYTLVQPGDVTGYAATTAAAITEGLADDAGKIVVASGIVFGPYTVVTPVTAVAIVVNDATLVDFVIPLLEPWTIDDGELFSGSIVIDVATGLVKFIRDTD